MHYLLFYDVAPDYLARRGEFRAAHLALAWAAADRGELVLDSVEVPYISKLGPIKFFQLTDVFPLPKNSAFIWR